MNLIVLSICSVELIAKNCLQFLVADIASQSSFQPTPVQMNAPFAHEASSSVSSSFQ